ncbi:MAG: CopG family transcriptional regulator [Chloroflexi bacterium]|nr:CopG family transcriptional regulator [Chloroflexota bacterium]
MTTRTATAVREPRVRTTLDLPTSLRDRIQFAIERGVAPSQNTLIIQALEEHLARVEQARIDAEFAHMEEDETYRTLQLQIAAEFAHADWEALQAEETQP